MVPTPTFTAAICGKRSNPVILRNGSCVCSSLMSHSPSAAVPLLTKAGVQPDGGCLELGRQGDPHEFVKTCAQLRHWARASQVKRRPSFDDRAGQQSVNSYMPRGRIAPTVPSELSLDWECAHHPLSSNRLRYFASRDAPLSVGHVGMSSLESTAALAHCRDASS